MYQGKSIAVVMPAYNEERLIATTVNTLPDLVDRVIVVDDASTDGTVRVVEEISDDRVSLIRLSENLGVGGAILAGHRQAVAESIDVAVVMAGDGQMDPEYLPQLLDPVCREGYDFAKANRLKRGSSSEGMPGVRLVGNYVMSALIKPASGYWRISDPLNGYTAITHSTLRRLPLDRIRQDYSFETDLLINLKIIRASIADVPIPAVYGNEVSGINLVSAAAITLGCLVRGLGMRVMAGRGARRNAGTVDQEP